tara:strand:+ start:474 stop:1007 length:534 start_codon:yes stop_codon:yes gene_type:complete
MAGMPDIRETAEVELPRILAVYPLAFPDEDLRSLVSALIEGEADALSLGAFDGDMAVGHILFTLFDGEGTQDKGAGALLAPLAVLPEYQRQGVGSALVSQGLEQLSSMGTRQVFVLGDPNYYGRFGFQAEENVAPPYPLPEEWRGAWQSMVLGDARPLTPGQCRLPEAWMEPALWQP